MQQKRSPNAPNVGMRSGRIEAEISRARSGVSNGRPRPTRSLPVWTRLCLWSDFCNLGDDNRKRVREALFCFQGLVEAGTESVDPIKGYFLSGDNAAFGHGPRRR